MFPPFSPVATAPEGRGAPPPPPVPAARRHLTAAAPLLQQGARSSRAAQSVLRGYPPSPVTPRAAGGVGALPREPAHEAARVARARTSGAAGGEPAVGRGTDPQRALGRAGSLRGTGNRFSFYVALAALVRSYFYILKHPFKKLTCRIEIKKTFWNLDSNSLPAGLVAHEMKWSGLTQTPRTWKAPERQDPSFKRYLHHYGKHAAAK